LGRRQHRTARRTIRIAFQKSGGARCVAGGSCYEYDWRYGSCVEDLTPRTPDTVYGLAKNSFSDALQAFALSTGLSCAWARMFFLYGPHENPRRLVPSIILSLLKGEDAKSSHGEQLRDYAHVQDVADGIVALLDSDCTGSYNVATGNAVSIRSIVEKLGALVGREDLLKIGAIPARANDAPLVVASTAKATRDFGWRSRIGLDAGLAATVAWWRAQQRQGSS
jgi:nucleoside-diphosphate-sugar epimerase